MFQSIKNAAGKLLQAKNAVVAFASTLLLTGGTMASAAVPAGVTTALTDSAADTVSVAGLVLAILVGIRTFVYIKKAL